MTVEAACTLPLFLIAMTAVLYLISAASLACSVSEGLQESGKKMALYAAVKGRKGSETGKTATKILSLAYAKNQINQRVRENVLARNLTDAGSKVELWRSRIMKEDEMIDLVAEYRMKFSGEFLKARESTQFSVPECGPGRAGRETIETVKRRRAKRSGSMSPLTAVYTTKTGSVLTYDSPYMQWTVAQYRT